MYKPEKCIACVIVFWIIAIVAVSLFGLFSAWAMSELAPAQQEAIAAINTPWISAPRDPALVPSKADMPVGRKATQDSSVTTSIATKR